MQKIIKNQIRCKLCGDVIESKHRHDFVWCKCGACAVDGGQAYLKRAWNPEKSKVKHEEFLVKNDIWEELSEYESDPGAEES